MDKSAKAQLTAAGVKPAAVDTILDDFFGCVYDQIKDDDDLLQKTYADSNDAAVTTATEGKAKKCMTALESAMRKAIVNKGS